MIPGIMIPNTASATSETLLELAGEHEVRSLELPEAKVVGPWQTKKPTRKAILADRYYVFGWATELRPPIDWQQDPNDSRTWCFELHTLTWLKEALSRHAVGNDTETLAAARDVVLDWVRQHLNTDRELVSAFAWYDMAVGLRAPYLGYVLTACASEEMLEDEDAEMLLEAARIHGADLVRGESYASGNNHGLFQDEGLYLLARQLPALPEASAWKQLAMTRLRDTLRKTVESDEGAHLEHSPAYQLAMVDLTMRLSANVRDLPELKGLVERMRRTAAWQVTPQGKMAQLGDTDALKVPKWMSKTAAHLRGLYPLFGAGQAFVREGDSYLAVSAAYHGPAHKHSDDTGFLVMENGVTVLGDAGRWGYYEDEPERLYARSAAAHNVLTVDGEDFAWRSAKPYGSGLLAAGEGDGWYAIVSRNPLLSESGVEHRRTLLYQPATALIVVDEVQSEHEHDYARHFHFGPELEAKADGWRVELTGKGSSATLTNFGSEEGELQLVKGRKEPSLLGWTYPGDRERSESWTAVLNSRAAGTILAASLSLGGKPLTVSAASGKRTGIEVELRDARVLKVRLKGTKATVTISKKPAK